MALLAVVLYLAAVIVLLFGWVATLRGDCTCGAGYLAAALALLAYMLPALVAAFNAR